MGGVERRVDERKIQEGGVGKGGYKRKKSGGAEKRIIRNRLAIGK